MSNQHFKITIEGLELNGMLTLLIPLLGQMQKNSPLQVLMVQDFHS